MGVRSYGGKVRLGQPLPAPNRVSVIDRDDDVAGSSDEAGAGAVMVTILQDKQEE